MKTLFLQDTRLMFNKFIKYILDIKPIFLLLILLISSMALYIFTNSGRLGLTLDSMAYLSAANYLKEGLLFKTISATGTPVVLSHYPPAISLILSIIPLDVWHSFYIINTTSFIVSTILTFYIILKATSSKYTAFFFSSIWLIQIPTLTVYSLAWSEPLFITFTLLLCVLWMKYTEIRGFKYIIMIVFITAFMPLIRYAGLFLLPINLILLFYYLPTKGLKKWLQMLTLTILQFLPYFIWTKYTSIMGGTVRTVDFQLIPLSKLSDLFKTLASFFVPYDMNRYIPYLNELVGILILGCIVFIFFIVFFRKQKDKNLSYTGMFLAQYSSLFISIYFIFLIFSMTFFDKNTPFDFSILSLAMPFLVILLSIYSQKYKRKIIWGLTIIYTLTILVVSSDNYLALHRNYYAYASPKYDNLEVIKYLRVHKEYGIITDLWEPIYARTGCDCAKILRIQDNNEKYWEGLHDYHKNHERTFLVESHFGKREARLISLDEYKKRYTLKKIYESEIETIYRVTENPAPIIIN